MRLTEDDIRRIVREETTRVSSLEDGWDIAAESLSIPSRNRQLWIHTMKNLPLVPGFVPFSIQLVVEATDRLRGEYGASDD